MKHTSIKAFAVAVLGLPTPLALSMGMYLNPNGLGEALVYPYYTVNDNYVTIVSIVARPIGEGCVSTISSAAGRKASS